MVWAVKRDRRRERYTRNICCRGKRKGVLTFVRHREWFATRLRPWYEEHVGRLGAPIVWRKEIVHGSESIRKCRYVFSDSVSRLHRTRRTTVTNARYTRTEGLLSSSHWVPKLRSYPSSYFRLIFSVIVLNILLPVWVNRLLSSSTQVVTSNQLKFHTRQLVTPKRTPNTGNELLILVSTCLCRPSLGPFKCSLLEW